MNKMSKDQSEKDEITPPDDMRPEYDFTEGVKGKHHQAYRQGHTVKIHQSDGSIIEQHFTLEEGAVFIEPDVRAYFLNSEAVNKALRGLIALLPDEKSVIQETK